MVKNTMGGKLAKKLKNSGPSTEQKAIVYPDDEQYYGVVDKFNSHSNINVYFVDIDKEDGCERLVLGLGVIRGSILKRIKKVAPGDIFIVSKRDFETAKEKPKLDILHKYNDYERNKITDKLPLLLKTYLNNHNTQNNKNKTVVNNEDDDNQDDIIFEKEKHKSDNRIKRLNNGPKSNTITNDYLSGHDLPESDDDEDNEDVDTKSIPTNKSYNDNYNDSDSE